MTYLPLPTYTETDARYTTVAEVKKAIGIDDTNLDDVVLQAIVVIEAMIDAHLGTSYPQDPDPNVGTDDALDPPPIEQIPIQVSKAAKLGAITLVGLDDTPYGQAGGEDFFGVVEPETAGQAFNAVRPILIGLRRSWGIG